MGVGSESQEGRVAVVRFDARARLRICARRVERNEGRWAMVCNLEE